MPPETVSGTCCPPDGRAQEEEKKIIQRVTFVRKLREGEGEAFVHGITKAALATDSFLSAASFKQTAQVSPEPQ